MTVVREMLGTKGVEESRSASALSTLGASPRGFVSSRTPKEFRGLAKRLAFDIVSGYVEHDRGHLDSSVEAFYRVYLDLFPEVSPLRARRAAELYVEVLVKQDEIENNPGHSSEEILEDPRWDDVRGTFLEFSRMLDLPESYAEQTTNYYRYHGVGDKRYVNYCLESDRIFTTKMLGDDYWSKILGSLLLILTECHDKHDSTGLEAGLQFATKYFEIILRAKAEQLQRAIAAA